RSAPVLCGGLGARCGRPALGLALVLSPAPRIRNAHEEQLMAILLAITVLLPLAGSLFLIVKPGLDRDAARNIALGYSLATLGLSLLLLFAFRPGLLHPQFAFGPEGGPYGLRWMPRPDIRFALGLDGLSLWLFLLTSLLMITAICSSWEAIADRAPLYYTL